MLPHWIYPSFLPSFLEVQEHTEKERSHKDLHRKEEFIKHPGVRNVGQLSFHWENLPHDWLFLFHIKAGN